MGALPRPAVSAGPHRELVEALHDLHHRAGLPSLRRIAAEAGCSHTTVSHILSSPRVPTWDHLSAVVEALDGDPDEFHRRWLALTSPTPGEVPDVPLVGRQDELALGHGFFRDTGRLLVLQGQAGSGKTRLLEALAAGADRQVLAARCVPLSQGEPLMPLAAVIRAAHRQDGGWVSEALQELPDFVTPSLAVLVPELGEADQSSDVDGAFARHRLFTAACLLLDALDRHRPCVVAFDDLHWADDSTRDFLSFAVGYDQAPPILAAWRIGDPDIGQTADDWRTHTLGLPGVTTIPVGPLEEKESLAQLRWLGIDNPDTARALHQRSGGLPLFTEHLARAADTDALPDRLADLLTQRLRDLPHQARRVADTLALLDRPATATHLPDLTGLTHDDLTTGLHQLADRHLLLRATDAVALGHPLLAQAAREHLLPTERHDHHRRLATALEHHPDAAPSEIAAHWRATGDTHHALPWDVRAAREAERRFALVEAADHWVRALEAWPPSLAALAEPAMTRPAALLRALQALFEVDRPRARGLASMAVQELGDGSATEAALVLKFAAMIANSTGDPESALDRIDRAMALVGPQRSVETVEVLQTRHFLLGAVGRDSEARDVAFETADLCREIGDEAGLRDSLLLLADHAQDAGDRVQVLQYVAAADPGPGLPKGDLLRLIHLAVQRTGLLHSAGAASDAVLAAGRPTLEAAEAWGLDTNRMDHLRNNLCRSLRRAGRLTEARAVVDHLASEIPDHRHPWAHLELAMLELASGHASEALRRARAVEVLPTAHLANDFGVAEDVGEIELWNGVTEAALARGFSLLETTRETDSARYAAGLLVITARAAAEHAPASGQRQDGVADRLGRVLREATEDPFAPLDSVPKRRPLSAQWLGELGRIDGKPDLEAWSTAIRHWDALERPFDAAYCRWRAAQACIELGQATAAARLLRRGLKDAREHVPLRDALSATLRDLTGS